MGDVLGDKPVEHVVVVFQDEKEIGAMGVGSIETGIDIT